MNDEKKTIFLDTFLQKFIHKLIKLGYQKFLEKKNFSFWKFQMEI